MNRRQFVQKGIAAVAATSALTGSAKSKARRGPNVLYVFSDEHRAFSLPGDPYSPEVLAPNLDAFRKQNFSMERCISTYPLCSPHRGILMTGCWPFKNGVIKNWIELGTQYQSLGQAFGSAGYHTAYVGKWHLSGPGHDKVFVPKGPHRQGFEDWHVWGAVDQHYNKSFTFNPDTGEIIHPMGYNATLMTDQAVKILHEQNGDRPWMMIVSWHPPHFPTNDAPPEDEAIYRGMHLKMRPNIKVGAGHGPMASEENLQIEQQGYYAHITAIDREFSRLLKALDDTGQADNTIVVYTSDHGEMMGSHGRMHKRVPHEESVRVPFFVRYPGVTPKGGHSDALFASIDIYPTMCSLAGIPVPPHCEGRNLSAALRGQKAASPEVVFLLNQGGGLDENDDGLPPPVWRGVRSQTHTYAVAQDGRWFLYDNISDPYQQNDLIADPAQAKLIEHFDSLILAWLRKSSDPFPYAEAIQKQSSAPS